ncbi:MAG: Asp-tRNA(Asn)/Glu-tRNA(Gln) amidotransferase subunit GatA [Clostridiaceae bacterium]|jgi:aspartyl-tRNA(Asn)/glutamyl-tRNA(Gln) amidotransferase subunit A|nr:Asp-tRNA(Asn)/Glu-tRNA(Gln) amidotransferase subunit GatA [Clostridiaceae bacterium]
MSIQDLTIKEASELLRRRKVSSRELTESALDRIRRENGRINAFITVCDDLALSQADAADKRLAGGDGASPLCGVPMGIKDSICTRGVRTTCASRMLEQFVPPYNATAVESLLASGSVLLGKLNMDEFGMGSSSEFSIFGSVKNPWDTGRVAGGSSGGPAAAVASGLCCFALGSDTGGSIRQPASFCGVVGLKPTHGLISRYGLVAYAPSLDQIGPITSDVTDCALVLDAIAGHDPRDPTSANREGEDYSQGLNRDKLPIRVGLPREYFGPELNKDVKNAVFKAVSMLEEAGSSTGEVSFPSTEHAISAFYLISSAEASTSLGRYDGIRFGYRKTGAKDLEELYQLSRSEGFGREVKRRILFGTHALSAVYRDKLYNKALRIRRMIARDFSEAFESFDVIVAPAYPETAFRMGEKTGNPLKMYLGDIYNVGANLAGLPALVVPCGLDRRGLPIGIQLIGKPFSEKLLLRAGYAIEKRVGRLRPPRAGEESSEGG